MEQTGMAMQYVLSTVGVIVAVVLFGVARRRATSTRTGTTTGEPPELSVVGGATWLTTWWPIGATWPLARLEIYSWGLRIGPNVRWLGWALPTTELRWNGILRARLSVFGIWLKWSSTPSKWILFGGGRGMFGGFDPRVVIALREAGVVVES